MMEHKGYLASAEFDDEADIFHGEVVNIRDVVTFQARTVPQLRKAFRDSVEDYLSFSKERGETPDKPHSGRFLVRISPALHRAVSIEAARNGSLNAWVAERLDEAVGESTR